MHAHKNSDINISLSHLFLVSCVSSIWHKYIYFLHVHQGIGHGATKAVILCPIVKGSCYINMKQEARFAVLDLLRIVHYMLQLTDTALVILVNSVAR